MKRFAPAGIADVKLSDPYLSPRQRAGYEVTIPASIAQSHRTGRIEAFKLDWKPGQPGEPHIFWDSDVAKVLEGMAYAVMQHPGDRALAAELDSYVDLIVSAQQPDGYLNVYFTVVEPGRRWQNLFNWHELYCAGHLMEAAVAHYHATGSRKFLDAMCRYADYIGTVFGAGDGKRHGYPGHEEIELALCRLAEATGNDRYYDLAKYFIDERGKSPNYFVEEGRARGEDIDEVALSNRQAHRPVREQQDAVGHSVRALYLYAGMVDVAGKFGDGELLSAARRLFRSTVDRRMYLTGGVGSTSDGEAYTVDYNLPNDTTYAESCASMALVQLAKRLLNLTGEGQYADVLEQALYNGALSGISRHGDAFFYANLLEVDRNTFAHNTTARVRQPWFGCSCCPTSFCRFLPQLGSFCWSRRGDDEYRLNIPAAGVADFGAAVFEVGGSYPNDGDIPVVVRKGGSFALSIRIPGWCRSHHLSLNGEAVAAVPADGYITVKRDWKSGDTLRLTLSITVDVVRANPLVTNDNGRIALMRGPVVYAFESIDNGEVIPRLSVLSGRSFELTAVEGLPGVPAIKASALLDSDVAGGALYVRNRAPERKPFEAIAIPYALWQNRGESSMAVWVREACEA